MKKIIFSIAVLVAYSQAILCQTGSIKGTILDETNQPMPNANVYTSIGGKKMVTITNTDGVFTLKPLSAGVYDVSISFIGYGTVTITGVRVVSDKITFTDKVVMELVGQTIGNGKEPTIVGYKKKLIDPEEPSKMSMMGPELDALPGTKDVSNLIRAVSSEFQIGDNGKDLYFRGSRSGSTVYYVDGVKVSAESSRVPGSCISNMTIYTGALPAKYGDVTGAVIAIETKSYLEVMRERRALNSK